MHTKLKQTALLAVTAGLLFLSGMPVASAESIGMALSPAFSPKEITAVKKTVILPQETLEVNGLSVSTLDGAMYADGDDIILNGGGTYTFTGTMKKGTVIAAYGEEKGARLIFDNAKASLEIRSKVQAEITVRGECELEAISVKAVTKEDSGTIKDPVGGSVSFTGDGALRFRKIEADDNVYINGPALIQTGDKEAILSKETFLNGGSLTTTGTVNKIRIDGGMAAISCEEVDIASKQTVNSLNLKESGVLAALRDGAILMAVETDVKDLTISAPSLTEDAMYFVKCETDGEKLPSGFLKNVKTIDGYEMTDEGEAGTHMEIEADGTITVADVTMTAAYGYDPALLTQELQIDNQSGLEIVDVTCDSEDFIIAKSETGYTIVPVAGLHVTPEHTAKLTLTYRLHPEEPPVEEEEELKTAKAGPITALFEWLLGAEPTSEEDPSTSTTDAEPEVEDPNIKKAEATVTFTVTKAQNSWIVEPSIDDYTQYEQQPMPKGSVKFGSAVFAYGNSESGPFDNNIPSFPGQHYLKVYAEGTEDYDPIEKIIPFTVKEHTNHHGKETITGDCLSGLTITYTCDICHQFFTTTKTPGQHAFGLGEVTVEPKCETPGNRHYVCQVCGKTYDEQIPALGHAYDQGVVTRQATCEDAGIMTFTCKNDPSHTYTQQIPALGHAYDEGFVTRQPTCTENGIKTFTCKNDSKHFYTEQIPALGHDYDSGRVTKEPTCTENGVKTFTCRNDASHTYTESIKSLGHDYDDGEVTKEATCEQKGIITYTCRNDPSHTYTKSIPATGHDYDKGRVTKEPTCTENGVRTFTCKNDPSHTYTEKIKKTGHDYDDGIVTKQPTCMGVGIRTFTCKNDKSHFYTEPIPKLDHKWDKGVITKQPTCGEEGVKTYTCAAGGETRTEAIPATGKHVWGEPLKMDNGTSELYVCTVCGETKEEKLSVSEVETQQQNTEAETGTQMPMEEEPTTAPAQPTVTKSNGRLQVMVALIYGAIIIGGAGIVFFLYKRQKKGY